MEEAEAQEQEAEHGGEDQEDEDEIHDRQPDEDEDEDEEYDEDGKCFADATGRHLWHCPFRPELQAAQAQVMIEEAGGFHEDDDAVDPEEDTYHKTLDKLDREKVVRYMGGEPVQEEQEEKAEEVRLYYARGLATQMPVLTQSDFVSPIENEDCGAFFFRALQTASQREPQVSECAFHSSVVRFGVLEYSCLAEQCAIVTLKTMLQLYDALQAVLPDEDKQRLQHLLQVMSQRAIQ
jgi:hypothetical protein